MGMEIRRTGLTPHPKVLTPFLGLIYLCLIFIVTAAYFLSVGEWSYYFTTDNLPGQFFYILSKYIGLVAIFFVWIQLVTGLLGDVGLRKFGINVSPLFHRKHGILTLSLVLLHIALFITATSIRAGHVTWHFLWFDFDGYYVSKISIGLIGCMVIMIGISVAIVGRIKQKQWRLAHNTITFSFVFIFWHALAIGSETRGGIMFYLIYAMAGVILFLSIWRLVGYKKGVGI